MNTVTVTTASKLSTDQRKQVKQLLEKRMGKVEIEEVVDPSVIGGIQLTIGGQSFDATIEGKLKKLESLQQVAKVTTAVALTPEQRRKIASALEKKYGVSDFEEIVDPTILGGVQLTIGSQQFDGTIAGKLERLKQLLLSNVSA